MTDSIQPGDRWRTRDGRVAEIKAVLDGSHPYPVRAVVGKLEYLFELSGRANGEKPHPLDLIEKITTEKEPEPMTIDPAKTYRTRAGKPVGIYHIRQGSLYPVRGFIQRADGTRTAEKWSADGEWLIGLPGPDDIILGEELTDDQP